ncbi:MAG: hypothetical protein MJY87_02495 [Fibrobacter sp.]|nr:hypothetical protein [Fibrobacter sp.]
MNFNEYKNSHYWETMRREKAGQITLSQLAVIIAISISMAALFYLAVIVEG